MHAYIHVEKNVSGEDFLELSRADLDVLFPADDQFLMGCKLYKLIQRLRQESTSTIALLSEL